MKSFHLLTLGACMAATCNFAWANADQVLFKNVNIFNGKSNELVYGHVLVEDNHIIKVSQQDLEISDDTKVIDGSGRTLMPGLIGQDVHQVVRSNYRGKDKELSLYKSSKVMARYMNDGFTSISNAGDLSLTLKEQVQSGVISGPRVFYIKPKTHKARMRMQRLLKRYDSLGSLPYEQKIKSYEEPLSGEISHRQNMFMTIEKYADNFEVLKSFTYKAAQNLPEYNNEKLGVIEEGAMADILLVNGNPLEDISLIVGEKSRLVSKGKWQPLNSIDLIMKDGVIYKNNLES